MNKLFIKLRYILILFVAFIVASSFFLMNNIPVQAVTQQNVIDNVEKIDDGISNWSAKTYASTKNELGQIPIGKGLSLGYTFGAARDSSNKVVSGADSTILTDSKTSATSVTNSKINVFLNNNGNYYGILHQGTDSYANASPQNASDTSLDFALVTAGTSAINYDNYSLLKQLKYKVYYVGSDKDGRQVQKIAGYVNNLGIYAEIVLRPSPTGAPLVQRELYVYNPSTSTGTKDFQVYFGEDTALDSTGSTANDDVPIYAIGNGEGLYLYSNKNVNQGDSKVYVTNNVEDGFNHFMGRIFGSPESWDTKGKADDSSAGEILNPNLNRGVTTKDNIGDTDREAGSSLLFGKNKYDREYKVVNAKGQQDSAYTLRWEQISLAKNQTAHFSSTMGASISGYALPEPSKTYTNPKQDADGWNHVGDTLHFTLDMTNNGFKSYWDYNQIQDEMPTGLEIDPDSVK